MEGARPDPFLRLAAGKPRGFWARGERWVAHAGVVARVAVESGRDRFDRVRREADGLVQDVFPIGGSDPRLIGRLRWYGGFAFGDDHRAAGDWDAYPAALFLLPRLELVGDADGVGRLRIRAPLGEGDDPDRRHAELIRELEAVRRAIEAMGDPTRMGAPIRTALEEADRGAWERAVREGLARIEAGRFSKVVLARTLDITAGARLDPVDVVRTLWVENRGTHVFLFEPVEGRALVGAAPETISTLRKGVFHCTAVAGSTRRGESVEESERLARELLASEKDRAEQRMVVDEVVDRLGNLADGIRVQDEPHVLTLARIQHLETEIRARTNPERHVLELVEALHPTPAVCGLPRDEALVFLRDEEPFQRGWYAGPVGWFDRDGDGVFAPALRTAVSGGNRWRLFAGAGIVHGSTSAGEWEETLIKFEPVIRALGAVAGMGAVPGAQPGGE